jgi:hypothetical protein
MWPAARLKREAADAQEAEPRPIWVISTWMQLWMPC